MDGIAASLSARHKRGAQIKQMKWIPTKEGGRGRGQEMKVVQVCPGLSGPDVISRTQLRLNHR